MQHACVNLFDVLILFFSLLIHTQSHRTMTFLSPRRSIHNTKVNRYSHHHALTTFSHVLLPLAVSSQDRSASGLARTSTEHTQPGSSSCVVSLKIAVQMSFEHAVQHAFKAFPSVEFIHLSSEFLPPTPTDVVDYRDQGEPHIYTCWNGVTVYDWDESVVVKYGHRVKPTEALHMKYVAEHTSVPVPRVLGCYTVKGSEVEADCEDGKRHTYIFTQRVVGVTPVSDVWMFLNERERRTVSDGLRTAIRSLRRLPPGPYIGSVCGRPVNSDLLDNMPAEFKG